jgi:outer membrane protein assembly factor BamB
VHDKFDGTTWTTAYTDPSGNDVPYPMAFVADGTLYFGGGGDGKNLVAVSTTDGASWTVITANLSAHSGLPMIGALAL